MLTKKELDILEDVISDAQSYYNQPLFYDRYSPSELTEIETKGYQAQAIIDRLRDELEEE